MKGVLRFAQDDRNLEVPLRIARIFTRGMGHGAKDCGMDVGLVALQSWRNCFRLSRAGAPATDEQRTCLSAAGEVRRSFASLRMTTPFLEFKKKVSSALAWISITSFDCFGRTRCQASR